VPTFLEAARLFDAPEYRERARRMLDWLAGIQFPEGGIQGGMIGQTPVVPVTFNTGQVLLGFAAGTAELGDEYRAPMRKAADWLVATMEPDGSWRKHATPFAAPGLKTYETHVAWGLFEAERVAPGQGYGAAGLRNVAWALSHQQPNGWFAHCCLSSSDQPLTHTVGYALRGVLEGHRLSGNPALLTAARRTADGVLSALEPDGRLPGCLNAEWRGTVPWVCLTGSVQIADCWLRLYELLGERRYLDAGRAANAYVRRTVRLDGPPDTVGGVKGSFPVSGDYGRFEYLNWAAKFFIDSNLYEQRLVGR
jgi:hypothetical protein